MDITKVDDGWTELNKEREEIEREKLKSKDLIPSIQGNNLKKQFYDKNGRWIDKLVWIIRESGRPMSIKEIEARVLLLEPEIKYKWGNTYNQIFQFLNKACSKKILNKIKDETKVYFYDLAESFENTSE